VPNSKYAQTAPNRRQIEQLQRVACSGMEGNVSLTAPQWHEP
jgi:hypothetical protein